MFTHFRYIFKIPAKASGIQRRAAPTHFSHFLTTDSQCHNHTGLSITPRSKKKKKNQALGCLEHFQGSQAVRPPKPMHLLNLAVPQAALWSRDHASGQRCTVIITSVWVQGLEQNLAPSNCGLWFTVSPIMDPTITIYVFFFPSILPRTNLPLKMYLKFLSSNPFVWLK